MKLLHTADWHLGKRLDRFSRLPEQRAVLEEICTIAEEEQVDAVLIAGDLFDSYNPPGEAERLFYRTLKRLSADGQRAVIAIAGNHDSPERIEAPHPLAQECGIILAGAPNCHISPFALETGLAVLRSEPGFVELRLPRDSAPLRLLLTPYANEVRLRTFLGDEDTEEELRRLLQRRWQALADAHCDGAGVNVLLTHLFFIRKGETPVEEPEDEKPILHVGGAQAIYTENVPRQMQYVALGHLHGRRIVTEDPCPMIYSSSPLAYSMSEAGQQKQVIIVEVEPGQPAVWREVPLTAGRPLMRKRCEGVPEAVEWLKAHPHAWVELTLVTDTFLTAEERRALAEAHDGVVAIIPEVRDPDLQDSAGGHSIRLDMSMEELFRAYFRHRHGQEPGEDILDLFREILAEN
ncbi:MAG: exonuclease subunit SbcD [Calditrichaeota bacterium]|nr:MAG: exonuclease subunit SbcD [Calditrichota bacterium]